MNFEKCLCDAVVTEIKKAGLELFELSGIEPNPRIDSVCKDAEICNKSKENGLEIDSILGKLVVKLNLSVTQGYRKKEDEFEFDNANVPNPICK